MEARPAADRQDVRDDQSRWRRSAKIPRLSHNRNSFSDGDESGTLSAGEGPDFPGDDGTDFLEGYGGDDTLHGGTGDDYLYGHSGNDTLVGGSGADELMGGSGADRFVFDSESGTDHIRDFKYGPDIIVIKGGLEFSDLDIRQRGDDTVVSGPSESFSIVLEGIQAAQLTESDFDFMG